MRIDEIRQADRPREKLLEMGAEALGCAELLAIILRTGTRTGSGDSARSESAVEVAGRLMAKADGSLVKLSAMDVGELSSVPGIKKDKAAAVYAAFELGRRFMAEVSDTRKVPVTSSGMVYEMMRPRMKGLEHEECWMLVLNSSRYVRDKVKMSVGGRTSTTIDVQEVIRAALDRRAGSIVLVHNHPSGNPLPGKADNRETEALRVAAEAVGLQLLDHIIVCDDCYFSYADGEIRR